jgi:BMFP domain-containing protein YqiC
MAMKGQMIRFGDDWWEAIQEEADRTGVKAAQYVRDSVQARVVHARASRGANPLGLDRVTELEGQLQRAREELDAALGRIAELDNGRASAVRDVKQRVNHD